MTAHPISFVELHDSWISGIRIRMDGKAEIDFSHIAVYHRTASGVEEYDIWSYEARIELRNVKRVNLLGELTVEDIVSDDQIIDTAGVPLRCERLIGGAELSRLYFIFAGSGATLSIECRSAQLYLLAPLEFMEKWVGPL